MRRLIWALGTLAVLCCVGLPLLLTSRGQPKDEPPKDPYTGIPEGFDFPADQKTLEGYRDAVNVSAMRQHVWKVFAGMTQPGPSGGALWETWYTVEETFKLEPTPGERKLERSIQLPKQLLVDNDDETQKERALGQSLFAGVMFNKEAHDHIRAEKLNQQKELDSLFQQGKKSVKAFPRQAVVLKPVWWHVKEKGLTALPVWDSDAPRPPEQGNPPVSWKRYVAVDPTRETIPAGEKADVTFGKEKRAGALVVPLKNFYYFQVKDPKELAALKDGTRNTEAKVGDYGVLVAMHVTTKEIPNWVWATFWWYDKPDAGPFALDRPREMSGAWRNYMMNVAYDMETPREFDGSPHACCNPYLEAQMPKGLVSNCMNCHAQSAWPGMDFEIRRGKSLPSLKDGATKKDKVKLDFLFSLSAEAR